MARKKKYKYYDFVNHINADKIFPVYFFTREENFQKDKAFQMLRKKLIQPKFEDFNYSVIYGEDSEVDGNAVLAELDNPPMMADRKLVIVKNFDQMHHQHRKQVVEYTKNPIAENVLVLETGKVDMRKKVYKTLKKNAATYYFYHAYDERDASKFIRTETRKQGINIDTAAVRLLVDYIGLNLLELNNELEKLFLYISGRNRITVEDVKNCVGIFKGSSIFELQNHLVKNDMKETLRILQNLLTQGTNGVFIIIMLTNFFKKLWKISILKHVKNMHKRQIENQIKGYKKRELIFQASRFRLQDFQEIFQILLDTDIKLKSYKIKDNILLELMIYKLSNYVQ